jgi:hypothetical protein
MDMDYSSWLGTFGVGYPITRSVYLMGLRQGFLGDNRNGISLCVNVRLTLDGSVSNVISGQVGKAVSTQLNTYG